MTAPVIRCSAWLALRVRAALAHDAGWLGLRGQRDARSIAEKSLRKVHFIVDGNNSVSETPLVIASAIQGQVSQPHQAADICVLPFEFAATEITLQAATDKGREFFAAMFGAGAASVNMKKSAAFDFERFAGQKGLVVG